MYLEVGNYGLFNHTNISNNYVYEKKGAGIYADLLDNTDFINISIYFN